MKVDHDIIFVSTIEDLQGLKKYQKIQFYCCNCGKLVQRQYMKSRIRLISRFKCKKCNSEQTCMEKYGYKNAAQVPEIKMKFQTTNLIKYGNICSLNGKEQIKKKIATWQKNFGASNPYQKKEVKEKVKENNLQKYGIEYAMISEQSKLKSRETILKRQPYLNTFNYKRYYLDDLIFDSSWELAFYIFMRDKGYDNIERNAICLSYYLSDNTMHHTYVDFKIGNMLIEIKSPYLLTLNEREIARVNVMKQNGVIIITNVVKYLNYVNHTYGSKYLKSLRGIKSSI